MTTLATLKRGRNFLKPTGEKNRVSPAFRKLNSAEALDFVVRLYWLTCKTSRTASELGMRTAVLRKVDAIALAAANAAFTKFCMDRMTRLCECYEELLIEKEIFDIAIRAIERVPELYTASEKEFFTARAQQIEKERFIIANEAGIFLFQYFEPVRLRRFREAMQKGQEGGEECGI